MCHSLLRPVTFVLPSHFFCSVLGTEEIMLTTKDLEAIQDEEGVHLALVVVPLPLQSTHLDLYQLHAHKNFHQHSCCLRGDQQSQP